MSLAMAAGTGVVVAALAAEEVRATTGTTSGNIEQKPERTPANGISPLDFAAIQGLYSL